MDCGVWGLGPHSHNQACELHMRGEQQSNLVTELVGIAECSCCASSVFAVLSALLIYLLFVDQSPLIWSEHRRLSLRKTPCPLVEKDALKEGRAGGAIGRNASVQGVEERSKAI